MEARWNPLSWGDAPDDGPATRLGKRYFILTNLTATAGVGFWIPFYVATGLKAAAIASLAGVVGHLTNLIFLRLTHAFSRYIGLTVAVGAGGIVGVAIAVRGVPGSEVASLWLITLAVSGALTGRKTRTVVLTTLVLVAVLGLMLLHAKSPPWPVPAWFSWAYPAVTSIAITLTLVLQIFPLAFGRRTLARDLSDEHERSERLLLNVMPPSIAARLKAGETTIADRFEAATVLFADIVGFTALSAVMAPERIVAVLDGIFSEIDVLAKTHGVEKIKTIGDAYMVVGGAPTPRADHAEAVAAFAVDLMAVFAGRADGVGVRIGIHSGPVVAGVIGKQRFLYDLWGDTVNTASRMESHGLPGRIQVSDATRTLLGERYTFEDRGEIALKGKGPTRCYLIRS